MPAAAALMLVDAAGACGAGGADWAASVDGMDEDMPQMITIIIYTVNVVMTTT